MEGASQQLPLKVCRHCSVASRTEEAACPNCGRSYSRAGLTWRWWYALPIVAIAFALGYFVISEVVYDDSPTVTEAEATAIELGTPRADVEDALGEPGESSVEAAGLSCSAYDLAAPPDSQWVFCYREDKLVTSEPINE
jgi:hypothetical protein